MNSNGYFTLETIRNLSNGRTEKELTDHFRAILRPFGIECMLVSGLPKSDDKLWSSSILHDDWPRGWYDRYISEGHYPFDPCVQQCQNSYLPFLWSELPRNQLSPRQKRVFDEATEFGMRDGICIPIHRPFQEPAVITMAGWEVDSDPLKRVDFSVVGTHYFSGLSERSTAVELSSSVALTSRETEIVRYASEGKTADQIALKLGITRSTVEQHLHNVRIKWNCANTTQAVAQALRLNLI